MALVDVVRAGMGSSAPVRGRGLRRAPGRPVEERIETLLSVRCSNRVNTIAFRATERRFTLGPDTDQPWVTSTGGARDRG